ncbi:hypothetical protein HYPBUDRAFT_8872 [Hyphopichia burtonii NRRL Y-1933]|uniref:Uncharacterized protein n=1 Tax=Hyphopichia burtonii NRRL Y-1933 TaxID=984485 RepID=A0A1E4RQI9_9ASCO|nr:hypothetical protein HYPBUDRAFT_8872 [Hyphopichia burtonii NRRL Y-1933]ODV69498.1 hypothetical protein HYPBUDRAFT_8872 [Hyphopichia burtonii NRRL Y-1933]
MPLISKEEKQRLLKDLKPLENHQRNRDNQLINNILPSYHMFESTILKSMTPSDENYRVDPPVYEVTPVSSNVNTPSPLSPMHSANDGPQMPPNNLGGIRSDTPLSDGYPFPNLQSNPSSINVQGSDLQPQNSTTNSVLSTFNEELAEIWENTVLANAHKLPNLSDSDNDFSKNLKLDIKVTESVCQKGEAPTIIDPQQYEYKQGDYIHGYVTIQNTSSEPIPFDMVYVVFEGALVVLDNNMGLIDSQHPLTVYKFLNMLDLFASWSYANIDRLVTDNGDPHDWCLDEIDPYDNTALSIDVKRFFQPNITYKRFFSFRIPEKLLDDSCEVHNFTKHTEIPPSIGVLRNLSSIPLMYLSNTADKNDRKLKDFSFIDTYINYSVDARIIGKASEYKYKPKRPSKFRDQYVIAKELQCPIRVIPNAYRTIDQIGSKNEQVSLFYRAFVDSIKNKISYGMESLANIDSNRQVISPWDSSNNSNSTPNTTMDDLNTSFSSLTPHSSSNTRLKQLYVVADHTNKENFKKQFKKLHLQRSENKTNNSSGLNDNDYDDNVYQYLTPYKKKSLTGSTKVMGVLSLTTPKQEYTTLYVPPIKFRNANQKYDTNLSIPLEVAFFYEHGNVKGKNSPPEIKNIDCELVVLTLRSKKHAIPVEFNHEMCFKDKVIISSDNDGHSTNILLNFASNHNKKDPDTNNFDQIVIKPMQDYYKQISDLIKKFGEDPTFRVESQLFKDLKALAFLQSKYINLPISDVKFYSQTQSNRGVYSNFSNIPWNHSKSETNVNYSIYQKKFDIAIDLSKCHPKGTEPLKNGKSCFDNFTLVPSFQNCLMARFYYVKVNVKMINGAVLTLNVPLNIEN